MASIFGADSFSLSLLWENYKLFKDIKELKNSNKEISKAMIECGFIFQAMMEVLPKEQVDLMNQAYHKIQEAAWTAKNNS